MRSLGNFLDAGLAEAKPKREPREWIALKGVYPHEEIALLPGDVKVTGVDHLKVPGLEAERHLVHVKPS